jgi:hypothetical protein
MKKTGPAKPLASPPRNANAPLRWGRGAAGPSQHVLQAGVS